MTDEPTPAPPQLRCGFCALLGLPNAGKSTLLNRVLELRLVAVSQKPQTTRNRIVGVKNVADPEPAQLVFVDTPGVQTGGSALRKFMRDEALTAAGDCDVAVHVVDANRHGRHSEPEKQAMIQMLAGIKVPILLALNKVDRLKDKKALLPMLTEFDALGRYAELIPISAKTGSGVERLQQSIAQRLPMGPALFPTDMVTDRAESFLAAELIREQLFRQLGKELPYATAVIVEEFAERAEHGDLSLSAVIYVERKSQRGIVVGKGGSRIKELGIRAREALAELFGCAVHLRLVVKVSPNWSRDNRAIRDLGYES